MRLPVGDCVIIEGSSASPRCLMIPIPVSQPLFPHSLSLFRRLSSKQTPPLPVLDPRYLRHIPRRTCANLLPSCRASTPDRIHHAWLQPPTLLTRRSRQRDASRASKVLACVYVETDACTRIHTHRA